MVRAERAEDGHTERRYRLARCTDYLHAKTQEHCTLPKESKIMGRLRVKRVTRPQIFSM